MVLFSRRGIDDRGTSCAHSGFFKARSTPHVIVLNASIQASYGTVSRVVVMIRISDIGFEIDRVKELNVSMCSLFERDCAHCN